MVHSEVYLNKYVANIAPFSTTACPDCSQNITKTLKKLRFCTFSLLIFLSIFPGGQLTPFAPMCRHPWLSTAFRRGFTVYPNIAHDAVRDCTKCYISFCTHALAVANTGKRRGVRPHRYTAISAREKYRQSRSANFYYHRRFFDSAPVRRGGGLQRSPDPLAGFKRAAFRYRTRGNGGREGRGGVEGSSPYHQFLNSP